MKLNPDNFYKICTELNISNNIWIGFSGGLDSSVLLDLAYNTFKNKTNYKLNAIHVNHNINNNALSWERHCENICKKLKINFYIISLDINQINHLKSNLGLEAALRNLRLKAWQQLLPPNDSLLLAHHLNDQIETLLLRLFRGTGLTGLGVMKNLSFNKHITILRPLLNYSKTDLENYANSNNLNYIIDNSNYDQNFSRNFLRHSILPNINTKWPKYLNNVARTIKQLQLAQQFINNIAKEQLVYCLDKKYNNILKINNLLQYNSYLQTEILRAFIVKNNFIVPDEKQLAKIYTEVIQAKPDRQPKLICKNYIICRYRNYLYVYDINYFKQQTEQLSELSFKTKLDDLDIYFGNYINEVGLSKAKKIFQKYGIPPWQRKDYPLVFQQGRLIAIMGLWVK